MLANLLFGGFLIALAAAMYFIHRRARQAAERESPTQHDLRFAQRQYRRRARVCLLLAVVGVAIIAGSYMTHPVLAACYWLCVVLLVFWIGWLALADLLGSQARLRELRDDHVAEHAALHAELAKYLPDQQGDSPATKPTA